MRKELGFTFAAETSSEKFKLLVVRVMRNTAAKKENKRLRVPSSIRE